MFRRSPFATGWELEGAPYIFNIERFTLFRTVQVPKRRSKVDKIESVSKLMAPRIARRQAWKSTSLGAARARCRDHRARRAAQGRATVLPQTASCGSGSPAPLALTVVSG